MRWRDRDRDAPACAPAAYKYPRLVEILDELPKTVSGKILRRELARRGADDPHRALEAERRYQTGAR